MAQLSSKADQVSVIAGNAGADPGEPVMSYHSPRNWIVPEKNGRHWLRQRSKCRREAPPPRGHVEASFSAGEEVVAGKQPSCDKGAIGEP